MAGVQNSGSNVEASTSLAAGLTTSTVAVTPMPPVSVRTTGISSVFSQGTVPQSGGLLNCGQSQVDSVSQSQAILSGGTSYSGYGGIYPQATPLQQVALALRQSSSPVSSIVASTTLEPRPEPKLSVSNSDKDKRPPQKRKFQELPIGSKGSAKPIQVPMHFLHLGLQVQL